jgi:hypothetical protein
MIEGKRMQFAAYEERISGLPSVCLRFICKDAQEAIDAMPDGPNAGYYADEIHICQSELRKRAKQMVNREKEYSDTLTKIFLILKEAGYDSNEMLDDLRDLVNDSQRPATDEDAGAEDDKKLSTQDLVNAVAVSLAHWWKLTEVTPGPAGNIATALLFDAYEALAWMYPEK